MDPQILAAPDQARLDALTKYETQIEEGQRRGREAIRSIAKALNKIKDNNLFADAGYQSFNQYVEGRLRMDRHVADKILCASDTILTLEAAGIETANIPAVEWQLVLLNKIPAEELPKAWAEGLKYLEEEGLPLNAANIRRIVDVAVARAQDSAPEPDKPRGVNPTLKVDGDSVAASERRTFTENGEIALERIGRLVGKDVRKAIENGSLEISDRDLIKWSEEDDQTLKNLAYYIVNERWSLGKALAYESALLSEQTTLGGFSRLATARGGSYEAEIQLGNATWEVSMRNLS